MKKLIFLSLVALFVLALSGIAYANFGVHGKAANFTPPFFGSDYENVWECAGCHLSHTGDSPNLLPVVVNYTWEFCKSCHGAAVTGANTNVEEGVYTSGRRSVSVPADSSTSGGILNAGGFSRLGGSLGPATLSKHDADSTNDALTYTAWGSAVPPTADYTMPLVCTSCHNPHGSTNYRIAEDIIPVPGKEGGLPGPATDTSEFISSHEGGFESGTYSPNYTADNPATTKMESNDRNANLDTDGLPGDDPGSATYSRATLADFCAACHGEYIKRLTGGSYRHAINADIWDVVGSVSGRTYNLTTDLPLAKDDANDETNAAGNNLMTCSTCHRAHGTDKNVNLVVPNPSPAGDSTLLRLNNRGVCQNCHKK